MSDMNFMCSKCVSCGRSFNPYWDYIDNGEVGDNEPYKAKQCSDCFENSLEEWEEHKRERIARENEY